MLSLGRFVTSSCILDYNTLATVDKFGNIAIVCHVVFQCIKSERERGGKMHVTLLLLCRLDYQTMFRMRWMKTLLEVERSGIGVCSVEHHKK